MASVGLGTFPFSNVFSSVSADEAARIVHHYLGAGGQYIQTSPYYAGVDDLIGEILRKSHESRICWGRSAQKTANLELQVDGTPSSPSARTR